MALPSSLPPKLAKPLQNLRSSLLSRSPSLLGSQEIALQTVQILYKLVGEYKWNDFWELEKIVLEVGDWIFEEGTRGRETVITNITLRALKYIREEYSTALALKLAEVHPELGVNARNPTFSFLSSIPPTPVPGSSADTSRAPSRLGAPSEGSTESTDTDDMISMFDLLGHKNPFPSTSSKSHSSKSSSEGFFRPPPLSSWPSTSSQPATVPPTSAVSATISQFSRDSNSLKRAFHDALTDLISELQGIHSSIAESALDFIHSGEVVMTLGKSRTIETFLRAASRKRKINVVVVECEPSDSGLSLYEALSNAKPPVPTTLIPYSSAPALIPKCSKILLPCHSVSADGSTQCFAGAFGLAHMAKEWKVPVLAVGASYKFGLNYGGKGVEERAWPGKVLPYEMCVLPDGMGVDEENEVEVWGNFYDLVPGDLIDLFVTNLGGSPRSLIYRLLSDLYGTH
ncbi:nagb/rpia/CoA transferase-like protein [Atractiella rhizophila]|nr:nagb/rpia/CoA transferase-like protein [Atractiella rhizophila]